MIIHIYRFLESFQGKKLSQDKCHDIDIHIDYIYMNIDIMVVDKIPF